MKMFVELCGFIILTILLRGCFFQHMLFEDWWDVAVLADAVHINDLDQKIVKADPNSDPYIGTVQLAMILLHAHDDLTAGLGIAADLDMVAGLDMAVDLVVAISKNK